MEKDILIQLVLQAKGGDAEAIGALYEAYKDAAYSIAMRETKSRSLSDDIVQETFIEVIQKIGDLQTPEAFPAWLKTVAYHQCTRHYKKKEIVHESQTSENEEGFSLFDTQEEKNASFIPDEALDQKEFRETILAMVDNLPDVQRSALYMFYYDDLPLKAIALAQGVSVNTANTRLNRGRKALKGSVEQYEKKHGIRLHSILFFPFFKWLLSGTEEVMSVASTATVAQNVSAVTEVLIAAPEALGAVSATTAATTTTSSVAVSTGIGAKLSAMPIAAKIVTGIIAVSMVIGFPLAISQMNDDQQDILRETEVTEWVAETTETENTDPIEPIEIDELACYQVILDQYQTAMANNFYYDEAGMPIEIPSEQRAYINIELGGESRSYKNYGNSTSSEIFNIYYALVDLNEDGIDELFIGAGSNTENIRIYDLFALNGEMPARVFTDTLGYRTNLTVFADLSLQIYSSGGWVHYGFYNYVLEAGSCKPTLRFEYIRDGEDDFYYEDWGGNRTEISEDRFLLETDANNLELYRFQWILLESPVPKDESRVNLIDTFTPEQQYAVNIFLSNFAESRLFYEYPNATEEELFNFAYEHCKLNTRDIEYLENDQCRLSAEVVDAKLMRFFDIKISHQSRGVFEFRNGYYYFPAMDSEFYGYLTIVDAMYQNDDSTYDVEFTNYAVYDQYNYSRSDYYDVSPRNVSDYPELEKVSTGTAILRDYIRSNQSASFQLIQLDIISVQ